MAELGDPRDPPWCDCQAPMHPTEWFLGGSGRSQAFRQAQMLPELVNHTPIRGALRLSGRPEATVVAH